MGPQDILQDLKRANDWAPTQWDSSGTLARAASDCDVDRSRWYVAPVTQTRDSDALERANFEALTTILSEAGASEPEDYVTIRMGHWGPGWYEITLIRPDHEAACLALAQCVSALAYYPVLSDEIYSRIENEDRDLWWRNASPSERREACKRAGVNPRKARNVNRPVVGVGED